jgi:hypothetical protein
MKPGVIATGGMVHPCPSVIDVRRIGMSRNMVEVFGRC